MAEQFKLVAEAADTSIPLARMSVVAGAADAVTRHAGGDPADAIMAATWAAAHLARRHGVPLERMRFMLIAAIEHAIECERDVASRERPQ